MAETGKKTFFRKTGEGLKTVLDFNSRLCPSVPETLIPLISWANVTMAKSALKSLQEDHKQ